MTDITKRVAVLGIALESNAFAPVTLRRDFEDYFYFEGEALARALQERMQFDFFEELRGYRPCELVPILACSAGAGGPCDHAFFAETVQGMCNLLQAAGPIDGVFILGHGAGLTTKLDDLDGAYFSSVRRTVGGDIPIVAVLDLHANVSTEMVEAVDVLISLRTNPHVDMNERYREAARAMNEMFAGVQPKVAFVRLPLVTPQVTQLTEAGQPYGDLVAYGQSRIDSGILNVSILPGFAFADSRHNGMAIVVTARRSQEAADALALEIAEKAWSDRHRYVRRLISVEQATVLAVMAGNDASRPALLFADVSDNPGGGGRGNTMWLVESFHRAGATGVQIGLIHDPALVRAACSAGKAARFTARFNREETNEFSAPFVAEATVLNLTDGRFTGRLGTGAGRHFDLGPCCVLQIGGLQIAVNSIRQQILGTDFLEHLALDARAARSIVVKSRGHFRAGFGHLIPANRIFEVDAPGLTTPNLSRVNWRGLRRPVFPIDADTKWVRPATPYQRRGSLRS